MRKLSLKPRGGNLKPELLYLPGELEGEVASNTRQLLNVETVVP